MSHEREDNPYLVFGDFGLFLRQELDEEGIFTANENRLRRSFQVIDEMLTSADPEFANLIQVGVLEVLADHPEALMLVKNNLSGPGQEKFEEWIRISQQL